MPETILYQPKYSASHALVIGVDKYKLVSPLLKAANDARAVAKLLTAKFGFPEENVCLLIDGKATRQRILQEFMSLADTTRVNGNDRILVFFAGHGFTAKGRRGETGFLVPVDGNPSDLSSLIRWDDLTRNAELIPAKHMLFLMDACYGGLALTRTTIPPGSMRLLKDMLQRYSRQVLTAGKADETVSDGGGKRADHSIFTSHVLDGLEGAASSGGVVTANGLMAYVYDKVGSDPHSHQTPHYGFIDGDGDFIFDTSSLATLQGSSLGDGGESEIDLLIKTPVFEISQQPKETVADTLKRLISDPSEKIRLDDFVSDLLRRAMPSLSSEHFPTQGSFSSEELLARLTRYEQAVADLKVAAILLARWGDASQLKLLQKIFARLSEFDRSQGGLNIWLDIQWYPILYLIYSAGIAALAADRFDSLRCALLTPIQIENSRTGNGTTPIIVPPIDALTDAHDAFKRLPGLENKYFPRTEYMFKKLQPALEDQLFLGKSYELYFDKFEIFLALVFADVSPGGTFGIWGPPGRFAWKERSRISGNKPFSNFVNEAKAEGNGWNPLTLGFFGGSAEKFSKIADAYAELLTKMHIF